MTTDPRIIPDEELAANPKETVKSDPNILSDEVLKCFEEQTSDGYPLFPIPDVTHLITKLIKWDRERVRLLLKHGKALAEQVERAEGLAAARLRDLDDERDAHAALEARLADRDKGIRDLIDTWEVQAPRLVYVGDQILADLRALLTEDPS